MKINRLFLGLVLTSTLGSCGYRSPFLEIKDQDMTIQAMQLKDQNGETDLSYKVRLTLNDKNINSQSSTKNNDLLYRMDSCFYATENGKKTYPIMVQYVANGVKNSYEYLVQFERNKQSTDSITIVYDDHYLNKKTYTLRLAIR